MSTFAAHPSVLPKNMKQKFAQLNDAEREWISISLGNARTLVIIEFRSNTE